MKVDEWYLHWHMHLSHHLTAELTYHIQAGRLQPSSHFTGEVVEQGGWAFTLSSDCSNPMFCCVHCALEAKTPSTRTSHQLQYLCWLVYPTCNCIVRAEHDKDRQNWTWLSQPICLFRKFFLQTLLDPIQIDEQCSRNGLHHRVPSNSKESDVNSPSGYKSHASRRLAFGLCKLTFEASIQLATRIVSLLLWDQASLQKRQSCLQVSVMQWKTAFQNEAWCREELFA